MRPRHIWIRAEPGIEKHVRCHRLGGLLSIRRVGYYLAEEDSTLSISSLLELSYVLEVPDKLKGVDEVSIGRPPTHHLALDPAFKVSFWLCMLIAEPHKYRLAKEENAIRMMQTSASKRCDQDVV